MLLTEVIGSVSVGLATERELVLRVTDLVPTGLGLMAGYNGCGFSSLMTGTFSKITIKNISYTVDSLFD